MTMLPQPPPDAPAPPPGEAAMRSRSKWSWILIIGALSLVFTLWWTTRPIVIRSHRASEQTVTVNNARQIGLALFEFETEYGAFPGPDTIAAVKRNSGSKLPLGTSTSNDYLRQLIAAGITTNEKMFFVRKPGSPKGTKRKEVKEVLGKGECGFAYLGAGRNSSGNSGRVLLAAPVIPGTTRFDPTVFDGYAVVLKMDNSVTRMRIDAAGRVVQFGKDILDPSNPIYGEGDKLVVAWPDF